ncbi:MAG: glucosamine-6-phosphate deaminase [Betaproteobacteria bacterium]|nr:glucosamine-6-phosphate deaminase [Betaproteobacteria bacterium]
MRLIIEADYRSASRRAAEHICAAINAHASSAPPFVLGLPTGSSPLGTYAELVSRHRAGAVSFRNVATINMDEYVGLAEAHPESYHSTMRRNLFEHVDIRDPNIHIPNGNASNLHQECLDYERKIAELGGIDLFFSGVGRDGHIAFNIAGSSLRSRTRVQKLNPQTIAANARFFGGDASKVPTHAVTVGVGTITDARQVLLVVSGEEKALALQHAVEGSVTHMWAITALQMHPDAIIIADEPAVSRLQPETIAMFRFLERDKY